MRRSRGWLLVVAVVFSLVLIYPYLGLDISSSRIDAHGSQLHYGVLVAHICTATVALLLGSLQFIPKVRAHKPLHRALGRVYLFVGVGPSAVTTIPVAVWFGRTLTQIGLITAAALWLITGGLAYRAGRQHEFDRHGEWMMRNYALTFLAVTSRILVPLLLLVQIPFSGAGAASIGDRAPSMIPVGQTLGWVINLIVVEVLIRREHGRREPSRPSPQAEDIPTGLPRE